MKLKNYARWIISPILFSLVLLQLACTAPRPPAPLPPIVVADSDQDGLSDKLDLCPDTAAGVVVDKKGCPLLFDADLDGVVDAQDACPDTPAKAVIDAHGCPLPSVVILPEPSLTLYLEYPTNEAEVSTKFTEDMKNIEDFVKSNPGQRFIIEGHTDSVGNEVDNMKLSLLRAENISIYLTEKLNVHEELLEARGFGESNPLADNNTQEGRQQNRRLVIIAIPQ